MVTLVLDSDVVVTLLRAKNALFRDRYDAARLDHASMAISSIVLHELTAGAIGSERPAHHLEALAAFTEAFEVLELSGEDAIAAGEIRGELARAGTPIGALDTLIAGQALARRLTLVTSNIRHFGRVQGLELIDWAHGSDLLTVEEISRRLR